MDKATVTFTTTLDLTRETDKTVKVFAGGYLAKSVVSYTVISEVNKKDKRGGKIIWPNRMVACQNVKMTIPKWLYDKFIKAKQI